MIDPTGKPRGTILYRSFAAVPRHRDVGTWTVSAALTARHALAADAGWRIMIQDQTGLYGGPLLPGGDGVKIEFDTSRKPTITYSGEDDMGWIRDRMAYPVPGNALGSQTSAYDIRTGVASTKILEYVNLNAGPGAQVARRLAGLTMAADPVAGGTVTGRGRFIPVLEVIQAMAVTSGLGFRIVPTLGTAKSFEVFMPRDLRGPARFSLGLKNLRSLTWTLRPPADTSIIGGGRGEETARAFISVTNSIEETGWGRREGFYDFRSASDADSNAELTQGANQQLAEGAAVRAVEVEPIDTPRLRFGKGATYWIGDRVTVDIYGGITMDGYIQAVEISENRTVTTPTRTVKPMIGDLGATKTPAAFVKLAKALSHLGTLGAR